MRPLYSQLSVRRLMALVAAGAVALWLGSSFRAFSCLGFRDLEVDLSDRTGRQVVSVSARACSEAWYIGPRRIEPSWLEFRPDDRVLWVPGRAFAVRVRFAAERSFLGRELSYGQEPCLALQLEYAGGTSRVVAVKIPDLRMRHRMSVTVD
jgi:hypothetical protein